MYGQEGSVYPWTMRILKEMKIPKVNIFRVAIALRRQANPQFNSPITYLHISIEMKLLHLFFVLAFSKLGQAVEAYFNFELKKIFN